MSPRWIMGLVILALCMGLLGGMIEGVYITGDTKGTLESLLVKPDFVVSNVPYIGEAIQGVTMGFTYASFVWDLLWFNYPFFEGPWLIFRYLFMGISVALVFSIIMALRGTSS